MNIDWVIPCRYAEIHDNLATIIGGGIDTFWVAELPTPIQVGLVIRLLAMAEELGPDQKHTAVSRVRDPNGEVLSEVGGEFAAAAEAARPEWLAGLLLAGAAHT